MPDSPQSPREVGFGSKSRASIGRTRKDRGLVEVSVHMTPADFAALKRRASWHDKSLSAQIRSDVQDANRFSHGTIESALTSRRS